VISSQLPSGVDHPPRGQVVDAPGTPQDRLLAASIPSVHIAAECSRHPPRSGRRCDTWPASSPPSITRRVTTPPAPDCGTASGTPGRLNISRHVVPTVVRVLGCIAPCDICRTRGHRGRRCLRVPPPRGISSGPSLMQAPRPAARFHLGVGFGTARRRRVDAPSRWRRWTCDNPRQTVELDICRGGCGAAVLQHLAGADSRILEIRFEVIYCAAVRASSCLTASLSWRRGLDCRRAVAVAPSISALRAWRWRAGRPGR